MSTQPFAVRVAEETLKQLDGYDLRLLEEIHFLCRCKAKSSKTGARYANPSEEYLSRKVGLSRSNVSRHMSKLSKLGILLVTHRRKVRERFQTNLYRILSWVWWRAGKIAAILRQGPNRQKPPQPTPQTPQLAGNPQRSNRVPLEAHITFSKREKVTLKDGSQVKIQSSGFLTDLVRRVLHGETLSEA